MNSFPFDLNKQNEIEFYDFGSIVRFGMFSEKDTLKFNGHYTAITNEGVKHFKISKIEPTSVDVDKDDPPMYDYRFNPVFNSYGLLVFKGKLKEKITDIQIFQSDYYKPNEGISEKEIDNLLKNIKDTKLQKHKYEYSYEFLDKDKKWFIAGGNIVIYNDNVLMKLPYEDYARYEFKGKFKIGSDFYLITKKIKMNNDPQIILYKIGNGKVRKIESKRTPYFYQKQSEMDEEGC